MKLFNAGPVRSSNGPPQSSGMDGIAEEFPADSVGAHDGGLQTRGPQTVTALSVV